MSAIGAKVLLALAEEEAARILILLDAIRCERKTEAGKERFQQHLRGFHSRLAKGLYLKYVLTSPADFAEVRRIIDLHRSQFYLEGEEYLSWICQERHHRFQGRCDVRNLCWN